MRLHPRHPVCDQAAERDEAIALLVRTLTGVDIREGDPGRFAAGLDAAGLAPGFAVIDEPQKGQSSTSSSMTD